MIVVIEAKDGKIERVGGNPTLLSIDGNVKAPLRTILAPSWTAEDRAAFGIHMAEPFVEPEGKVVVGQPRYERQGERVVQVYDVEDVRAPEPSELDHLRAEIEALTARVDRLEAE